MVEMGGILYLATEYKMKIQSELYGDIEINIIDYGASGMKASAFYSKHSGGKM